MVEYYHYSMEEEPVITSYSNGHRDFFSFIVRAAPTAKSKKTVHNLNKRNFVPNRFDIVDNEIKRK